MPDFSEHTARLRLHIEEQLTALFPDNDTNTGARPSRFTAEAAQAHAYPLLAGGKRIRPLIVLLTAGAMGSEHALEIAKPAALALELVHTYSLVHDDLPCMDNDDLRRGRPTTHVIYGEAKALLAGDGLLTRAFELINESSAHNHPSLNHQVRSRVLGSLLTALLAKAAGYQGMILGQWIDISSQTPEEKNSWPFVEHIQIQKTGKLLSAAFEMGTLAGLSAVVPQTEDLFSPECRSLCYLAQETGLSLGIAFQIIDDILDVTASKATLGKTPGKDAAQDKSTAVSLLGIEGAQRLAQEWTERSLDRLAQLLTHPLCASRHKSLPFKDDLTALVLHLLHRSK